MDPISTAIVAALSAGAINGLTETSKTAITDAYTNLKDVLTKKFGAKSEIVQALDQLEAKPVSTGRQQSLQEELLAVHAEQDHEVVTAAQQILALVQPQQAGLGQFTIQNNAPVHGQQNIGDHNTNTLYFGYPPKG